MQDIRSHCQKERARRIGEGGRHPAEWIYPPDTDAERVVLFLHGGAYILGSLKSHGDSVAWLSRAAGVRGLLTDYRLTPEHVFAAALDDALTAYRWLLARGTRPRHIVLLGDSAWGPPGTCVLAYFIYPIHLQRTFVN